jgi:hypothetical protein
MRRIIPILFGILLSLSSFQSRAQPPTDNPHPEWNDWFERLVEPNGISSCCSIADCHVTDYETDKEGHFVVIIAGRKVQVPDNKVLSRVDNPTGKGVVCYNSKGVISCFVRAAET